ncbi:MAG: hypothetical protein LBR60_05125 [Fibrobacter sp.]|jgi:hypothetical protein|nr:hypothetical protein [Fibrobacter sp.]
MNLKVLTIAATVLAIAIIATLFMQKGNYVGQAKTAYETSTKRTYDNALYKVGAVNDVIQKNTLLWKLACDAQKDGKTPKAFATLEQKIGTGVFLKPETRTDTLTGFRTRKVAWNSDYYIVASFDKKTEQLKGIDVSALLGKAAAEESAVEEEPEAEEEATE